MKLTRKMYSTRKDKIQDLILGIVGWHLLNAVLLVAPYLLLALANPSSGNSSFAILFGVLPLLCPLLALLANVGGLIYFGLTRSWIALGALASIGFYLLLSICAGLAFTAYCFLYLSGALR